MNISVFGKRATLLVNWDTVKAPIMSFCNSTAHHVFITVVGAVGCVEHCSIHTVINIVALHTLLSQVLCLQICRAVKVLFCQLI